MCTEFGADSSSGFSFRARTLIRVHPLPLTHKVTDATDQHTHASATPGVGHKINRSETTSNNLFSYLILGSVIATVCLSIELLQRYFGISYRTC